MKTLKPFLVSIVFMQYLCIVMESNYQENNISSKIFEKARILFNTIGVRNTTMDDLAKELGISKKTLYKEIDNKADLVKLCVEHDLKQDKNAICKITETTENAIEELLLIAAHINAELQLFHPSMIKDITKFYPESWLLIEEHKENFAKNNISNNLKKGIKQGFYRKDIRVELTTVFQLNLCLLPIQMDNKNYKAPEVYQEILKYNLHAICTQKGIDEFQQLIKKINL